MSQLLNRVTTADGINLGVCFTAHAKEPLAVKLDQQRVTVSLRSTSLDRKVLVRWLRRHGIPWCDEEPQETGDLLREPLVQLPTLVVCCDARVRDIAQLYARSTAAPFYVAENTDEVFAIVEQAEPEKTVSLFLLNDRLEEELCHAIARANRSRRISGRLALPYGFFAAFTPEQLAWLVVKTWIIFLRSWPERTGFARYDFATNDCVIHYHSTSNGATSVARNDSPWLTDDISVLGLRTHGAPFDVSMGRVVLCGQLDSPLGRERTLRAPSCFHDNVCFRVNGSNGAPTELLKAVEASPLVWCLDSCASVPFTGNAFGVGTSYAFGLIAGAAVGVIGPFLDITTAGVMNRQCEALLATGATLGETVAAVCSTKETVDFDRFLLIGSPDLRLLPPKRVEPQSEGGKWRFILEGKSQYAWRLAIPPELPQPVNVVSDDGGDHWAKARVYELQHAAGCELLVILDEPTDVDGWVMIGSGGKSNEWFDQEAALIHDNVRVLKLCPFVDDKAASMEQCQKLVNLLRRVIQVPDRLRCRLDVTILWANLQLALNELHAEVAGAFLAEVAAHDVNLDRVPGHGFILQPTERVAERCPTCGVNLYVTHALWRRKRSYVRRWVQCVNCSGIAMVSDNDSLVIQLVSATASADGFLISLEISNRTDTPVQALIAGLARRGSLDDALGPAVITVPPNSSESFTFTTTVNRDQPGVISYRLLVLCKGGVQLFALKHVVEPASTFSVREPEEARVATSPAAGVSSNQ